MEKGMEIIDSWQSYQDVYQKSIQQPDVFWDWVAKDFYWRQPWTQTFEWDFHKPEVKWFINGS
jgi:acetyl-CoA synthetase